MSVPTYILSQPNTAINLFKDILASVNEIIRIVVPLEVANEAIDFIVGQPFNFSMRPFYEQHIMFEIEGHRE